MNAVLKFFTDNPLARWIAALLVALLGWEAVKRHLKDAGRKAEREASAVKQAQIREAVTVRTGEIITEEREHADAAITARDSGPSYPDADSVPDEIGSVLFRGEGRDKTS
jgi:flagellar biosynthesis/type III secretory pathway M-ring protein FliF/YscJ